MGSIVPATVAPRLPAVVLLAAVLCTPIAAQEASPVQIAFIDSIFLQFESTRTPGCAVGVSEAHSIILERAYGMADLEHEAVNTAETIFEPGSVSKQFTAAATILLALDGRISLEDDIRKYIPELPDYGQTLTIRHLLNHTSGLRDWGSVAAIEGWPRTTRVHTHTHVLDIASRQMSLNYPPGEYYSYTNTGYNLQAILVERVTGMSFADFSKERIFEPLGMTKTEWRDDFTRIVKDRAIAYRRNQDGSWSMLMPFENVHGNGGLLTTVGDLLRFTHNLDAGELGGPRFIEEMHRQGILNSGRTIAYASGLFVGEYKGVREVQHSGATAAYQGFLTRFPDQGVAVAVMCNTSSGNSAGFAHSVADLFLGDAITEPDVPEPPTAIDMPPERLAALAGGYRITGGTRKGTLFTVAAREDRLQAAGTELFPVGTNRFRSARGTVLQFDDTPMAEGRPSVTLNPDSDPIRMEPVAPFDPTETELVEYTGTYRSDEAEATFTMVVENGGLMMKDRWGEAGRLVPLYPDAFQAGGATVIFSRDASGGITEATLSESRVWDLRFRKKQGGGTKREEGEEAKPPERGMPGALEGSVGLPSWPTHS
jgi:CubicO group peptidase (beta-lactamase class C family)